MLTLKNIIIIARLQNFIRFRRATELLAVALQRNILGQFTLSDLLSSRVKISEALRKEIHKGTLEWGVEVERVEM